MIFGCFFSHCDVSESLSSSFNQRQSASVHSDCHTLATSKQSQTVTSQVFPDSPSQLLWTPAHIPARPSIPPPAQPLPHSCCRNSKGLWRTKHWGLNSLWKPECNPCHISNSPKLSNYHTKHLKSQTQLLVSLMKQREIGVAGVIPPYWPLETWNALWGFDWLLENNSIVRPAHSEQSV